MKADLKKIKARARANARNRKDPRFLNVMGFLVNKGLLFANYPLPRRPNQKLFIADAIWAGKNVEPRILEVLPAAVLRMGAHFDLDPEKHRELAEVVARLRLMEATGPDFFWVPYAKAKVWASTPLKDKRTKPPMERKLMRTFRLKPAIVQRLKELAASAGCSEAEILERRLSS